MADYDLGTARGRVIIDAASLARAQGALNSFGNGLLAIGALAVAGFVVAANAAASFEQKISGIEAVTNATESDLERIRVKALQLGRDTIFSANQVAEGFEALGKAGLSVDEILRGAGDAATYLAAAGDLKIDRAAEIAANALRTFNLEAEQLPHVADLFAAAANRSTVEVEDLATSMRYVGGVAAALNIPFEDVITTLGQLGNAGIRGSTAGTSLRRILLNLNPVSVKAAATMKELGIITEDGANRFFDASGKAKSLADIQEILYQSTKDLSEGEKVRALNTIFGNRAVASALILARDGKVAFDDFNASMEGMTAADVAATRMDNLRGDIEKLRGSLETLLINLGRPVQDMLRGWVQAIDELVDALGQMDPETQKLVVQTVAYTGAALLATGLTLKFAGALVGAYKRVRDLVRGMILLNEAFFLLSGVNVGGALATALGAIGSALAAIVTSPLFILAAVVAALAGGFYLLYQNVESFRNAFEPAVEAVENALGSMGAFFASIGADWSQFFDSIALDAQESFDHIGNAAQDVFDAWKRAAARGIEGVREAIQDGLEAAQRVWDRVWDEISDTVGNIWTQIQTVVRQGTEVLQRIIAGVVALINGDWGKAWDEFKQIPGLIWDGIFETVRTGINQVFTVLSGAKDLIVGVGKELWSGFLNAVEAAFEEVLDFFRDLPGRIVSAIGTAADVGKWLLEHGRELVEGLAQGAREKGEELREWFEDLPQKILDWMVDLHEWLKEDGKELVEGFIKGVDEKVKELTDYLKDEGGLRKDVTTAIQGIDEWLKEDGKKLVAGFIQGIEENAPQIGLAILAIPAIIIGALIALPVTMGALGGLIIASFVQGLVGNEAARILLLGWFGGIPGAITGAMLPGLIEFVGMGGRFVGSLLEGAVRALQGLLDFFTQLPGNLIQQMANAPLNFWSTARRWLLGGSPGMLTGFESALGSLIAWFNALPGKLINAMGDVAQILFNKGLDIIGGLGRGLSLGFDAILGWARTIPSMLSTAIGDVTGVFKGILSGAQGAIEGAAGGIAGAANRAGAAITGGFKAGLGIGSPSQIERWMFQINDTLHDELRELEQQTKQIMSVGSMLGPMASGGSLGAAQVAGVVPLRVEAETGGSSVPVGTGDTYNIYPQNPIDSDQLSRDIMWQKRIRVRG